MLLHDQITTSLAVENNTYFLAHNSVGQQSRHGVAGFSSQDLTTLKSRYQPELLFISSMDQGPFPSSSRWLKEFSVLSCRTEVPISLPAVSWDSAPRDYFQLLATCPLLLQSSNKESSSCQIPLTLKSFPPQ